MRKITLSNLTLQTSGIYRCEVSTDGPKFEMVFKSANMNVLGKYYNILINYIFVNINNMTIKIFLYLTLT